MFKRIAVVAGIVACLAVLGIGVFLLQMGKTVDCLGTVTFTDAERKIVRVVDANGVQYTLKTKFYTVLKNLDNKKINEKDLEVGDVVTANYRGEWKGPDSGLTATYIKVSK